MRQPVFLLSDLLRIKQIFAPESVALAVFDPLHRLVIDRNIPFKILRAPLIQPLEGTVMADLTDGYFGTCRQKDFIMLGYINNPDQSMRWIFNAQDRSNSFLSLYNAGSFRSRVYRNLATVLCKNGLKKVLLSGVVRMQQKLYESVKVLNDIKEEEEFSLFLGTKGAPSKAVIEVHQGSSQHGFIKIPLSNQAIDLINHENEMLKSLSRYDFTTLRLPVLSNKVKGTYRLSNVKPQASISYDRINEIHIRSQADLYNISHDRKQVMDTVAWSSIEKNMQWLRNEIQFTGSVHLEGFDEVYRLCCELYNTIPLDEQIAVSIAHGDFTPWNMYSDEIRLFVYDWEMASNGIPMLFDLFHFTFQSTILKQRKDFNAVMPALKKWLYLPLTRQILSKYQINTGLNYRLYLLFTVSYYLRQYLSEKDLPVQAAWMMKAWQLALQQNIPSGNPTTGL